MNTACLMIGSNIEPRENTRQALLLLVQQVKLTALSTPWETESVGYDGPNFLNTALLIETDLDAAALKAIVLSEIEQKLGRVRTVDKNAPRTIDLDILIFNGEIIDDGLWQRDFLALPTAEILPDLVNPTNGISLREVAGVLRQTSSARPRPDLLPLPGDAPPNIVVR